MSSTPDQHIIDRLVAQMDGHPSEAKAKTNGGAGVEVPDEKVIEKARAEKNGKFDRLWRSDLSDYGGDDSRADDGFVHKLWSYTQDEEQIRRIHAASGLHRPEKSGKRRDYLQRSIERARVNVDWFYEWPDGASLQIGSKPEPQDEVRSRSHSLGNEVMSNDPEHSIRAVSFRGREKPGPREWIVDRAICQGHPASWYGESGIAKSLLAAHLGIHVAGDGIDYWAGLRIKTVPVIYGDWELDEVEHLRRVQELAAGVGLPDVPAKFHYIPLAGLPTNEAFRIAAEECARLGAGLFIVDSVGFALDGDSELAKDVLRFYRECIQPIRDAGTTPFLIDHQAKVIKGERYSDKQEFGSVYKTNAVRSSFQIRGSWDGNELTATFTHKKTNFGPKVEDFSLKLVFGAGRIEVARLADAVPNPDREPSKKEQVYAAAERLERATAETIHAETGIKLQTVRNSISELVADGDLVDTGEKAGRSRIVVTHSHTTQGTGTGTSENEKPLSADLAPGESATVEQVREIRQLVREGMSEEIARTEVLGKGWVP
jgi:hypothetical protein